MLAAVLSSSQIGAADELSSAGYLSAGMDMQDIQCWHGNAQGYGWM